MRVTNRSVVLDLLEKDFLNNGDGLTTVEISERLQMQRTNVSRILNELVNEGLALKNEDKRPVLYTRSNLNFEKKEPVFFEDIIGWDSSLKQAVHLAKAAIMYPNKSLYTLLVAPTGSGKSLLARKMYEYALFQGVLEKDSPYVKMNCLHYVNNLSEMNLKFKEALDKAENGFLYIDNCNLLDAESKNLLSTLLDDGFLENDGRRKNNHTILVCSLLDSIGIDEFSDSIKRKFTIKISFPPLKDRSLDERFQFIKKFLCSEADKSNCQIKINSEVLIALLLYNCKNNIKQLLNDIRLACASAYVRDLSNNKNEIELLIMDFPHYVRSGFLNYKNQRMEVDSIVKDESNYIFECNKLSIQNFEKTNKKPSIYEWISDKNDELNKRGFSKTEISTIVNVEIETEFSKYRENLVTTVVNKEQLSQLVDSKIIDLVDAFLKRASKNLGRFYSISVYYGLCLHLQSLIFSRKNSNKIKIERILEFIELNKEEYAIANEFCRELMVNYDCNLTIDEIVVIAMFICKKSIVENEESHPTILVAMHGEGIAKALAETTRILSDFEIYHYDLSLNKKPLDAYEDVKKMVLSIAHSKGILVITDIGSLKDIFNMIAIETGIMIKQIEMPFIMMVLDCCRKLMISDSIEEAYESIINRYKKMHIIEENINNNHKKVIISLCLTGDGGAKQIKQYLEKNYNLGDIEIIALQLMEQSNFMIELNRISKDKDIICIIGTFDPNIYGIPFIPIENIFSSNNNDLNSLLANDNFEKQEFINNSKIIFEHLSEELKNIDCIQLEKDLVHFILCVEKEYGSNIEMNEKVGLLVHVACAVDKLKGGLPSIENPFQSEIIQKNMTLYRIVEKGIIVIERNFGIKFNNDEIANIICIIKKSKKG